MANANIIVEDAWPRRLIRLNRPQTLNALSSPLMFGSLSNSASATLSSSNAVSCLTAK
jgi:hypothetical protein